MSIARTWANLTQDQKEECLDQASDELAQRLCWYMDALKEASALRELTGQAKLEAFRQRLPQIWEAIQQLDPQDYDNMMKDWRRLETRQLQRPSEHSPLSSGAVQRASAAESPMLPMPSVQGV